MGKTFEQLLAIADRQETRLLDQYVAGLLTKEDYETESVLVNIRFRMQLEAAR